MNKRVAGRMVVGSLTALLVLLSIIMAFGAKDWEGLEDANGKPLPCTDGNKAFLYDYCYMVLGLPEDLIGFVMTEIQKMMRPVEEIEKNSSTSRTGMQEESSSTAPPAEKSS